MTWRALLAARRLSVPLMAVAFTAAPIIGGVAWSAPAPAAAAPAAPAAGSPPRAAAGTERPPLAPTRESSVLYKVSASGAPPIEARVTIQANGAALRIDMPDNTYLLVHPAQHGMAMVVPGELMVVDMPYQPGLQDQFVLSPRMKFNKRGPETVAGVRCNGWDVLLDTNRAIMCITDDGVLLRSISLDPQGRRNLIEAVSVSYTPAPAADYLPPPDFEHMADPGVAPQ